MEERRVVFAFSYKHQRKFIEPLDLGNSFSGTPLNTSADYDC